MSEEPKKITGDDFSGLLLNNKFKNKIVIIKFYVDWCGFCQRTKPVFNQLANQYKNDSKVIIGEYDCEDPKNKEYMNEYINKFNYGFKVNGYPTIVIYKDQLFKKIYDGPRTVDGFNNEIQKLL